MDRTKFLNKIKSMFSEEETDKLEEKLKDVSTSEGLVLRIGEGGFVDGEKLLIVSTSDEGEETEVPAPEGEYTAEGQVVTTDSEGVIVSVVEAKEEEEKPNEVPVVEEEMSAETPEWVKKLEARMDSLELSSSNIAESMSAIDELSKVVSKIANLPSDEEVKLSKKESEIKLKSNTREERLKFFSKK